MSVANMKKTLKREDILAGFISNLIHDYEHPGFSNSFVIRTKHPLSIRYNDQSVLENHHVAAAYSLLNKDENNIFSSLDHNLKFYIRKLIIEVVLATDLSQHFLILTKLKTQLDNNFPTTSQEDQTLLVKLLLKLSD